MLKILLNRLNEMKIEHETQVQEAKKGACTSRGGSLMHPKFHAISDVPAEIADELSRIISAYSESPEEV